MNRPEQISSKRRSTSSGWLMINTQFPSSVLRPGPVERNGLRPASVSDAVSAGFAPAAAAWPSPSAEGLDRIQTVPETMTRTSRPTINLSTRFGPAIGPGVDSVSIGA